MATIIKPDLVTNHSVTLTGLNPNTTYMFTLRSTTALGKISTATGTFKTVADAPPTGAVPVIQTSPQMSGPPAQVGQTLVLGQGTWSNSPTAYTQSTFWDDDHSHICSSALGNYVPVTADIGHKISYSIVAHNGFGDSVPAFGGPSFAVIAAGGGVSAPVNTGLPVISGTAQVGSVLSVTNGTWSNSPTSFAYQWKVGGTNAGTNSNSYTPVSGDVGKTVTCTVTATNTGGSASATSSATSAVISAPVGAPANTVLPSISGTAQEGQTLTVSNGTWTNSPTGYAYQWKSNGVNVGTNANTYVPVTGDVGHTISCTVTATNGGGSTSATSAATSAVTAAGSSSFDSFAELPRSTPIPPSTLPTIDGTTQTLTTSSTATDFQNAINAAAAADGSKNHLITLPAQGSGSPFILTGQWVLTAKNGTTNPSGTGKIIIATNGTIPARGTRIRKTADRAQLAHLRAPANDNSGSACVTAPDGSHHYWFYGLEIETNPTNALGQATASILQLGRSDADYRSVTMPHDFIVDHCYIHGQTDSAWSGSGELPFVSKGISLHSGTAAIVDCWVDEIHRQDNDCQALWMGNGDGPYYINNCTFSASGENIMFGGFDPPNPTQWPADVTITHNELYKELRWGTSDLGYSVKNLFETKACVRVLVEGNEFYNTWDSSAGASSLTHAASGQNVAILLKCVDQSGGGTQLVTNDITFRKNSVHNFPCAMVLEPNQNNAPFGNSQGGHRWSVHDNVFWNRNNVFGTLTNEQIFFLTSGANTADHISIVNNTFDSPDNTLGDCNNFMLMADDVASVSHINNFVMRNNICGNMGQYGIQSDGVGFSLAAMKTYLGSDLILEGNVLLCDVSGGMTTSGMSGFGQTAVSAKSAIGYTNSTPTQLSHFVLSGGAASTSGVNGTAYSGADVASVVSATAGVVVAP